MQPPLARGPLPDDDILDLRRGALVAGRVPPAVVVEAVDEHTCVVHAGADTPQMLAVYLGMLDLDFEVGDPPELVEQLRALAERYRRAITRPGPARS